MAYFTPRVAMASVALGAVAGCQENCQDACQRDYRACVERARTADEKAVCNYNASLCLNKCPAPHEPQLAATPDQ